MKLLRITAVRMSNAEANSRLSGYIFDAMYGGARTPRGIDPDYVAEFINENLEPTSPPSAYRSVLELVRFYERPDTLPTIKRALTGKESSPVDVARSARALNAIGDLGSEVERAQAAAYIDKFLVPNPALTAEGYPPLLEALVALTPAASPAALTQRLARDIQAKSAGARASVQGMMAYDKLVSVQQNDLTGYVWNMEMKKLLLAAPPDVQRAELAKVYLGLSTHGGPVLNSWSARMLRKEAMEVDAAPVCAEIEKGIDLVDEKQRGKDAAAMIVVRAAQAVNYLGCKLSRAHQVLYEKSGNMGNNFLWDDLPVAHASLEEPPVAENA